jgi:hypothetical protein
MANCISSMTLIKVFGNSMLRNQKTPTTSSKNLDLYTLDGFADELLINIVNFDVLKYRKIVKGVCSSSIINQQMKLHFTDYIRYCEECMRYNFHSIFHQIRLLLNCPFHDEQLVNVCLQCGNYLYYRLQYSDHYQCKCGSRITTTNNPVWKNWGEEFQIKNNSVIYSYLNL